MGILGIIWGGSLGGMLGMIWEVILGGHWVALSLTRAPHTRLKNQQKTKIEIEIEFEKHTQNKKMKQNCLWEGLVVTF